MSFNLKKLRRELKAAGINHGSITVDGGSINIIHSHQQSEVDAVISAHVPLTLKDVKRTKIHEIRLLMNDAFDVDFEYMISGTVRFFEADDKSIRIFNRQLKKAQKAKRNNNSNYRANIVDLDGQEHELNFDQFISFHGALSAREESIRNQYKSAIVRVRNMQSIDAVQQSKIKDLLNESA